MMPDAEGGSSGISDELFSADDKSDDVYIDLDSFWSLMGPASPLQGDMLEDLSSIDVPQGVQNSKDTLSPKMEIPGSSVLSPSHYSEASDSRTGSSDCFSESVGTSFAITPPYFPNYGGQAPSGTPNYRGPLHSYGTSHVTHDGESSIVCHTNHDQDRFGCSRPEFQFKNTDTSVIDIDEISQDASHTESSSCEINMADIPGSFPENGGVYLFGSDDPPYVSFGSVSQQVACDGGRMVNTMDDVETIKEESISVMPSVDLADSQFGHHKPEYGTGGGVPLNGSCGFSYLNDMITMQDESKNPSPDFWSYIYSKTENDLKVGKNVESITSNEIVSKASEVVDDIISRKYSGVVSKLTSIEGIQWSPSNSLSLISCKNYVSSSKDVKENIFLPGDFLPRDMIGETNSRAQAIGGNDRSSDLLVSGQPGKRPLASVKAGMNCQNMEYEVSKFNTFYHSNITYQGIQSNKLDHNLDDDADVYILEDMSTPAVASNPDTSNGNLFATSFSTLTDPIDQMVTENSRPIPNDERSIFRIAVEDLSQPKSETEPPDGVLAVPLLKHQRIALSWMVNQETKSAYCSGGILADDQGLGKTVSTIALILKERPPSSEAPIANMEQCKTEMCDLDEDNGASETCYMKDPCEINVNKTFLQRKGRPSAGTLVVCPTSVIRQWSEEFQNKVTREADLSVLVYHGSNRTKDPLELVKYDVVITTYAIVSMEVRKQPTVDENDDQTGTPFEGFSSSKKRKLLETASCKKSGRSKKSNKEVDSELLETISGPLAKVGWFRVVLDEAQTIKNHKTQVARACWGLRAKRRWCLSGTPIQNAIDDLYSYFKFLRNEPYATLSYFRDHIKFPINKNPKVGFTKLQAVLKTVLLRRTKGTCIDGKPIVNIPPKTIELKRVDFSMKERDFYCKLEADSRAQFAEYANAGTVRQNYVNILLLLLRLRQACGHPLLVRGFSSTSRITSSIEMAKKLPPEKIISLLNCLEASLAICGICSDPPEDAVVTVCGHVFCNQCICEHMIGDEMKCPNKICKTHLTLSHIFSNTTLRSGISDHLNPLNNQTPSCSHSELDEVSEACSLNFPEGSSKIKAALELLTSLSKPQVPTPTLSSSESIKECYGSDWFDGCDSAVENGTSEIKSNSHNPAEVMGEKAIVFSQWTRMLDLLEDYLKSSSIQFRRLDGTMPIAVRDRAVKEFNTLPEVSVMIMSLKAASLGLNMVAACHVILLDLWWNPTTEDQAIDRAHRIGQTRPVSVYRLTVRNTVEDRILALQEKKREMVASAFGEEAIGGRQARLTVDDLKYLFRAN